MRLPVPRVLVVAVVLAVVVAGAWVLQREAGGREASHDASRPPAYTVAVTQAGTVLRRFGLSDLRALRQSRVTIAGKEQDGPSLLAVLAAAGVTGRHGVTVLGAGLRDAGRLVLPASRIDGRVIFDFADRGTVKICSPNVAWSRWVRDVKEICVD